MVWSGTWRFWSRRFNTVLIMKTKSVMKQLFNISARFYIFSFLFSMVTFGMQAFELQISPVITSSNGYEDVVTNDGTLHHDITDANVILQINENAFSVTTGAITAFSANYTVTNLRGIQDIPSGPLNVKKGTDQTYIINDQVIPLKTYSYKQNADNEYEYLFEYTIIYAVDSVEQTPVTGSSLIHFIVYDKPNIIAPDINTIEVVLDQNGTVDVTTSVPLPTGGYNPEGWHYNWTGVINADPDDQHEVTSTFDAVGIYDIAVDVYNSVPGATEHWADATFNFTVRVNDTPSADYKDGSIWHILKVDSCKLEVTTNGGNLENWKYSWKEGSTLLGSDSFLVYNSEQDKEIGKHTITVTVTNTSDDNKNVWFNQIFSFDVNVYGDTSVSQSPMKEINIVDGGDPARLSIAAQGGASEGWVYEWSTDGVTLDDEHPERAIFSINNTSDDKKSYQVSVIVTNKVDDVVLYPPKTYTFNINVYPKIDVQKNPNDDIVYIWVDGSQRLEITANGGNPNGWTYEWIGKDCSEQSYTYNAGSTATTETIKVRVRNKSVSDDDPQSWWYDDVKTFTIQVYSFRAWQTDNDSVKNVIYGHDGNQGIPLDISYQGEGEWSFNWSGNNVSGSGSTYYYLTKDHGSNPQNMRTEIVTVDVTYILGTKEFKDKKHFTINIFPAASVTGEINDDVTWQKDIIVEETVTLRVNVTGGNPDGWTYKWNDKEETTNSEFEYVCNEERHPDRIKVIIYNRSNDGELMFNEEQEFQINVWPKPQVAVHAEYNNSTITECFVGDVITLVGSAKGGKGDWTCQWTVTDGFISNDHSMVTTYSVPNNSTSNPTTYNITYRAFNELATETRHVSLKAYKRGSIVKKGMNQTDYPSGAEIELESDKTDGYPNGWTYVWTRTWKDKNGASHTETLPNSNTKDLTTIVTTTQGDALEQTYTLTATNKIGENIGSSGTLSYFVNVWPEITLPNELVVKDQNHELQGNKVREGNIYYVSVDNKATGGYQNSWYYQWSGDGYGGGSEIQGNSTMPSGNSKSTVNRTYSVNVFQYGPNNADWASETFTEDVIVYRRPVTPIELVRKGSGQSHTIIVNNSGTGLDDETLFNTTYDYTYRFGYEENGVTHLSDPVNRRYFQMRQEDYNKSDGNIWAVAEWHYDDGSNVTSGRINVSGVLDEDFDFSEYPNSAPRRYARMYEEGSGVDEHSICSYIALNGYDLYLNFDQPTDISINVYNVQGQQLQQILLPSVTSCSQQLNFAKMASGVYLIEVVAGDYREVKKVIVR